MEEHRYFSREKAAWAWSQEAANECALMSRHLSHWWVNSRSIQVEPEPGMQGAQEGTRHRHEARAGQDPQFSLRSRELRPLTNCRHTVTTAPSPSPPGPLPRMFQASKAHPSPALSSSSSLDRWSSNPSTQLFSVPRCPQMPNAADDH